MGDYGWLGRYLKLQCTHTYFNKTSPNICENYSLVDHSKALRKSPITPKRKMWKTFEFPSPTSIWNSKNIIFFGLIILSRINIFPSRRSDFFVYVYDKPWKSLQIVKGIFMINLPMWLEIMKVIWFLNRIIIHSWFIWINQCFFYNDHPCSATAGLC